MTINQIFSVPRFVNLFREETASGYRMTLIVTSVVFGFMVMLATIMAQDHDFADFHQVWYGILLLGGGFYFTSNSFNELNQKEQRMQYLSLPTSIFEKFSMKLLITTVGYVLVFTLAYWLFAQVADLIAAYFNHQFLPFEPTGVFYVKMIKLYLVLQSIFILGAVAFDRLSFFKTNFALAVLGFVLFAVGFIIVRVLFAEYFAGIFEPREDIRVMPGKDFQNFAEYTLWPILQKIFWYVLAPFCWVVAYFKLKEREV